jgi:nucleoside-diphosphate-sugar epimerase
MKILVTGSNGFIGKAFCEYSLSKGVDNNIIYYDLPDDILDLDNLHKKINLCDYVVHFAAVSDLNESLAAQDKNFEVNIKGTYNIAKVCNKYNKKLVFISTCCVYGNSGDDEETENGTIPRTKEPYACSKVAGEYILRGIPGLQYTILRIGTTYGPGMRKELFCYIVLDSIKNDKTIKVHGTGLQTRNYIYIDDLVKGIYLAVEKFDDCKNETINLCNSFEDISVLRCIEIAEKIIDKKAQIVYVADRYAQIMKEDILIYKAFKFLRWQPEVNFVEGMRRTWRKTF